MLFAVRLETYPVQFDCQRVEVIAWIDFRPTMCEAARRKTCLLSHSLSSLLTVVDFLLKNWVLQNRR